MNLQPYLMIKQATSLIEKARRQADALVGDPYASAYNITRDATSMGHRIGATPAQIEQAKDQVFNRYHTSGPYSVGTMPTGGRVSSPTVNAAFNDVRGTRLSSGSLGRVLNDRKLFNIANSKYPEVFSKFLRVH